MPAPRRSFWPHGWRRPVLTGTMRPVPPEILRLSAFTDTPEGGNPAGVVLDASGLDAAAMLAVAADVGYSETAFALARADGDLDVRYFSPVAEVPFCGHATIALGVAHAQRHGPGALRLHTPSGLVGVATRREDGRLVAMLTSVPPAVAALDDSDRDELLGALGWTAEDLDPALPPRVGFAGAHHPVLAARTRERLADLRYDFDRLRELMEARDWTTVQLVWREAPSVFHARDPFPVGGVVEDPATGAAAAALGAYLRALRLVDPPVRVTIHQGHDLGRPSLLLVDIPAGEGAGIVVSGAAVPLDPGA
jgi:PhzF family phenazine biosynthesis protein